MAPWLVRLAKFSGVWGIDNMVLSKNDLNQLTKELASANSSAIQSAIPQLKNYWVAGSWLGSSNPFENDTVHNIKGFQENPGSPDDAHLCEYIAASVFIHSFDGWSYLGRALEAEMAGDPHTARHLSYYAELRAAMSVLASQGIGVFDRKHIVVVSSQHCKEVGKRIGTHDFVWNALEILANTPAGANVVLTSIKPAGIPLLDWTNQLPIGNKFVAQWLHQWGFDLQRYTTDRNARNQASYRPTAFTTTGPRPISNTMQEILQFWKAFEPGAFGGFPSLDGHLLRNCLNHAWSTMDRNTYTSQIDIALQSILTESHLIEQWSNFLSHENLSNSHEIIRAASSTDNATHQDYSRQILARATLLLRVATGASAKLLSDAGLNLMDDLAFWQSSASVRRRLWKERSPPSSPADLWADISEASDSIDEWLDENGQNVGHYDLWFYHATSAAMLATTERAFLWGISS